jgi:hypothetical protein
MKSALRFAVILVFTLFCLPSTFHAQWAGVTTCSTVANLTAVQISTALNSINLDGTALTIPAGPQATVTKLANQGLESFSIEKKLDLLRHLSGELPGDCEQANG